MNGNGSIVATRDSAISLSTIWIHKITCISDTVGETTGYRVDGCTLEKARGLDRVVDHHSNNAIKLRHPLSSR